MESLSQWRENWLIAHQAKCPTFHDSSFLHVGIYCFFSVLYHCKLHLFWFWTVEQINNFWLKSFFYWHFTIHLLTNPIIFIIKCPRFSCRKGNITLRETSVKNKKYNMANSQLYFQKWISESSTYRSIIFISILFKSENCIAWEPKQTCVV